jgi:hypothetical protein
MGNVEGDSLFFSVSTTPGDTRGGAFSAVQAEAPPCFLTSSFFLFLSFLSHSVSWGATSTKKNCNQSKSRGSVRAAGHRTCYDNFLFLFL